MLFFMGEKSTDFQKTHFVILMWSIKKLFMNILYFKFPSLVLSVCWMYIYNMSRVKDEGSQLLILSDPNIMTCKLTEFHLHKKSIQDLYLTRPIERIHWWCEG